MSTFFVGDCMVETEEHHNDRWAVTSPDLPGFRVIIDPLWKSRASISAEIAVHIERWKSARQASKE